MSDYIVQLKDAKREKNQYPITLTRCVVTDSGEPIDKIISNLEEMTTALKAVQIRDVKIGNSLSVADKDYNKETVRLVKENTALVTYNGAYAAYAKYNAACLTLYFTHTADSTEFDKNVTIQLWENTGNADATVENRYKTINDQEILGSGNISVQEKLQSGSNIKTINDSSILGSGNLNLQETLVSGSNIKTINDSSILESGNLSLQETLVSGSNIKTINNTSILGSGNISVVENVKSLSDTESTQSLVGNGSVGIKTVGGQSLFVGSDTKTDIEFKTINDQSIIGNGSIDLSNLIATDPNGFALRPILESDSEIPEGYSSIKDYNKETYELFFEGKTIPTFDGLLPKDTIIDSGTVKFIYSFTDTTTLAGDSVLYGMNATFVCGISDDGSHYISLEDDNVVKLIDTSLPIFPLDKVIHNGSTYESIVDELNTLAFFNAMQASLSWNVSIIVNDAPPFIMAQPIAQVVKMKWVSADSYEFVTCVVDSAKIGVPGNAEIEYNFNGKRYKRTYTIATDITYTEEEIGLGGGGTGTHIGGDMPDPNDKNINLWVDTTEGEETDGVIIGGDGYLGDILIDDEMSLTSTNAVQNKVITAYIEKRLDEVLGDISRLLDQINGNA